MLSSRGTADYLSFVFPEGIDASHAYSQLIKNPVARYLILRTTFIIHRRIVMQIVLKSKHLTSKHHLLFLDIEI